MQKKSRLACTLLCFAILSFIIFIQPSSSPAIALGDDLMLDLAFAPPVIEAGTASYPIGYVRLISNSTGEPILAASDLEVGLLSGDASIAFVPSRVVIPAGSDYVRFNVEVSDLAGQTEISALYGNKIVSKIFKVVDAVSLVEGVDIKINLPSENMQTNSRTPISVYLESNGNILQAPEDITVQFEYESSLLKLDSASVMIKKGSYYAINYVQTLEKSGNAFIKAVSNAGAKGQLISTVTNVAISQTQPNSIKVYVFPDKVGLNEHTIDIFVGVVDAAGVPTLAADDIKLDLFSSAYQLTGIADANAIIKKGEFGFYTRQSFNFYNNQTVTVGASASGLGASTAQFNVLPDSLKASNPKAVDKMLKVFTIPNMPSEADSIVVYQLNAIERDCDDIDFTGENPCNQDTNKDGLINSKDHHAIDDLADGQLYPIESQSIYSQNQGNLNIVSGDNLASKVVDPGSILSGSSYGTAMITSGRQADAVDFSISLANFAVGSNVLSVTGGLNPTQTTIFSPGGSGSEGKYRVLFDRSGFTDLFLITFDSGGRPSNSDQGVKYLVKPINELAEIKAGTNFASMHVKTESFRSSSAVPENTFEEVSAVPVGINSDSNLKTVTNMTMLFYTGTTSKVLFPFNNTVAFSKSHQIGVVQLRDVSGNPVLASDEVKVKLSSSSLSRVLPTSELTIPVGKSFANFDVSTFGRADNFTVYAKADGLQASSAILAPVVAELPASFLGTNTFDVSVPTSVTVSTPIQGTSITWGASAGLQLLGNSTTFVSAGNSQTATIQVMSDKSGTFTLDATLLKDGFKPTRISKEVVVGPYHRQMNAILVDTGVTMLGYNQPTLMKVSVKDANGVPVQAATVQVEDTGPSGMTLVTSVTTDASGIATFIYMPTHEGESSNLITLTVTASKDGYQASRTSKVFGIDSSTAILPPIPILGNVFTGLPSWTSYAIIGGIAAIGGGLYILRKPSAEQDDEPLTEDAIATEEQKELVEQPLEDKAEEEED